MKTTIKLIFLVALSIASGVGIYVLYHKKKTEKEAKEQKSKWQKQSKENDKTTAEKIRETSLRSINRNHNKTDEDATIDLLCEEYGLIFTEKGAIRKNNDGEYVYSGFLEVNDQFDEHYFRKNYGSLNNIYGIYIFSVPIEKIQDLKKKAEILGITRIEPDKKTNLV